MVQSRKVELEVKIEVDVPLDIVNDKERLTGVKNGLIRSISNGRLVFHLGSIKSSSGFT